MWTPRRGDANPHGSLALAPKNPLGTAGKAHVGQRLQAGQLPRGRVQGQSWQVLDGWSDGGLDSWSDGGMDGWIPGCDGQIDLFSTEVEVRRVGAVNERAEGVAQVRG